MAMPYPQQPYYLFHGQPQWPEDVKPALTEDDSSSVLDDKVLDSSDPADMAAPDSSDNRQLSMPKLEDDYSVPAPAWQERRSSVMPPARHYSSSSIPLSSPNGQYFGQINGSGFMPHQSWPLSARSGASTPTPFFSAVQETFNQQVQYSGGAVNFPTYSQQEPISAVSMSPQSSQGGWASTTSSDAAETGRSSRHGRFRPTSPMLVVRSDGIRKKNAKFEIPKERNLQNIDTLIMQSTNEDEKKELKQQKRLLRNRQAALDSRQRKKLHTEKLEQEKKAFSNQRNEMEEAITSLETNLNHEREQWVHQRQQYEQYIQQLQYERDEAIRTKTLETAELRRMNNILKDTVRDLERRQNARAFSANSSDAFSNDFTTFRSLDLEDNFDDEFSFINGDDLKMEEPEALQRQATPRPATSLSQAPSSVANDAKAIDVKVDAGFSWDTFTMCVLAGAFIVSQAGSKAASAVSSAAVVSPNMPALSDNYRAEAGNVLNAVLASGPETGHEILPSRPAQSLEGNFSPTVNGMAPQGSTNALDNLHSTLTTPSRQQQAAAAFGLSATSYNHIANADGLFDEDDEEAVEVKPTRMQQLWASMQAESDGIEKLSGLSSKPRERSVLLDRVPEKVLRDFRDMIARVE